MAKVKNLTKRLTAYLLTVIMLASLVVSAGALSYKEMTDYNEAHWAAAALEWAVENGLIKGYDDKTIRPDDYLTRAEMATIINRAFGATILAEVEDFDDISVDDWFYNEMAKAVNMGTFEGTDEGKLLPNDNIRREEAFAVIARALVLSGADAEILEKFGDYENVSAWAEELLADLADREFVNGSPVEGQDKNNLYPREYITRAEFAQLLHNIFVVINGNANVKGEEIDGNVLFNYNKGKLTLENVTVDGDLVIADGVGLNNVVLKNVVITGRLVIRGGKSVTLTSVTADGGVVIRNNNTTVNFQNYENESVFKGYIAKTPVTFKSKSSGISYSGGSSTVKTGTYKIEYYTEKLDGTYELKESASYNGSIGSVKDINDYLKTYTGFTYDASNANNISSGTIAGNSLVLKAYYTRNTYTLTYDFNGGKAADDSTTLDVAVKYGQTVSLNDATSFTKTAYGFNTWSDVAVTDADSKTWDATTDLVIDETNFTLPANGGTITLYAQWVAIPDGANYTIEVYKQKIDGTYNDVADVTIPKAATADTTATVTAAELTYSGFTLDETLGTLTGTVNADGTLVLKAYMKRNTYTVIFDYDGGKDADDNGSTSVSVVYEGVAAVPSVIPTKDGYKFDAWYTGANGTGSKVETSYTYNTTDASVTVYANWIKVYTVTFADPQGAGTLGAETVVSGQKLTAETIASYTDQTVELYEGNYYNGITGGTAKYSHAVKANAWVRADDNSVVFTDETVVDDNITVWPKWNTINAGGYTDRLGGFNQNISIDYNDDTRAIDTVKDIVMVKLGGIIEVAEDKDFDDKLIGKLDIIVDADRNIKLVEQEISIVKTLGKDEISDEIKNAIETGSSTPITPEKEAIIDDVVDELLTNNTVTITSENVEVIEHYGQKVEEITYDDVKDSIPDSYKSVMDETQLKNAFNDAKTQYTNEVYLALVKYYQINSIAMPTWLQTWYDTYLTTVTVLTLSDTTSTTAVVTDIVKIKVNPISGFIVPKYNAAMDKFESKFYAKYSDNEYFLRLLEIFKPDTLISGTDADQDNDLMLSGYKLLSNDEYFEFVKEAVIMADEAGKKFKGKLTDEELDDLANKFSEIMTDYMTTINKYLDDYAVKVINKITDYSERLEKLKDYEDRRLTTDDIKKISNALKQVVTGYDTTTAEAYDKAYSFDNDKLNGYKFNATTRPDVTVTEVKDELDKLIDGFFGEFKGNYAWFGRGEFVSNDD